MFMFIIVDDNNSDLEEDVDDVMEIDAEPAINSGEALEMLDKLQVFFEMNDAGKRRVTQCCLVNE